MISFESAPGTEIPTQRLANRKPADALLATHQPAIVPPEQTPSLVDFLAPAQQADELGRLGSYRVLELLGHGGMGVVFRAEDVQLGRQVALKAMLPALAGSPSARERFLREARAAAALKHPNIVAVFQVAEDRGIPFLVMELLAGEALDQRLHRDGKLSLPDVLHIGREIALGLAAAHEHGLMHRDIKPANVFLESSSAATPHVKILDFGLARSLTGSASLTHSGMVVGTPAYMAPEQAAGNPVDHRCDLFSLGCVLYRMATGERPFQGEDTMAILTSLALRSPRPPRDVNPAVPRGLSDLILRLLAKTAEERPATAREVADQLATLPLVDEPAPAPAHKITGLTWLKRLPRSAVGRGVLALAVGVALLLIGQALWFFLPVHWLKPDRDPAPWTPQKFTNALGMEFVLVPAGTNWLGGARGQPGPDRIDIPRDFYLGTYEVTQAQWQALLGTNPSAFSRTGASKSRVRHLPPGNVRWFPVEMISWDDTQVFLARLNERTREAGWTYRLPTSAEWEYACRGGPTTERPESGYDFYFQRLTNKPSSDQANFRRQTTNLDRPCKVGNYFPNRLGLYDMHGNIAEWCEDKETDWHGKMQRVARGGNWALAGHCCRACDRVPVLAGQPQDTVGLRVARVPTEN